MENKNIEQTKETKQTEQTETKTDWSEVLEKTEAMANRIETANKESKAILESQQELTARNLLGGKSNTGEQPEQKKESNSEYRQRIEKEVLEGKHD